MLDVETRVAEMCAAPAGCAFLLVAEASGLTPAEVARPEVAIFVAAAGQREIQPWRGDHTELVTRALAAGPRLAGLARAILGQPAAAWMFAPLDRDHQLWVSEDGQAPNPAQLVTPSGKRDRWEAYARKPRGALFTSTSIGSSSSALATVEEGSTDYGPDIAPPITVYQFRAAADARVFEVSGPADWRRLCLLTPGINEDGGLVPSWAEVAREWDAVHLSLGGFLTAEQVRVDGPEGWTEHGFWDFEQTVWLRWVFSEVTRLPPLTAAPVSPVDLGWPEVFQR